MSLRIVVSKVTFLLLFFGFSGSPGFANQCLPGWKYLAEVNISNPGSAALTDFQVLLEFNSATLVAAGKMNSSGSDLRFLDEDSQLLSHWIVPGTFNTAQTKVWIKVSAIPAGSGKIYMAYGNNNAINTSSGEATFEFFDDFIRGTANWQFCGGGHYQNDGNLVLYANETNNNQALMTTTRQFATPFISEMAVDNYPADENKQVSILQLNGSTQGFGLTAKQQGVEDNMALTKFGNETACFSFQSYDEAILSSGFKGQWYFSWHAANEQQGTKGEDEVNLQTTDAGYTYPASLYSGVAVFGAEGSVSIDWYRVRKHANAMPTLSLEPASEIQLPAAGHINAGSNSPLCAGEDITLFADELANASYEWFNPSGTRIATTRNHTISNATQAHAGTYQLVVTPVTGDCASITVETEVVVAPETQPGTIVGETAVCAGENSGFLELTDYTGEIVAWEYSLTGGEPWATISNTSSRQYYQDLTQTTYYRAVVKSGDCAMARTGVAKIDVHAPSDAGIAKGSTLICENESAEIDLEHYTGTHIIWEKSEDKEYWQTTAFVADRFETAGLLSTTWYRAIVTNGTCSPDTSNTVMVEVNCGSEGGVVEKDTVCAGSSGNLELTGYTGNVLHWEVSENGGKPWSIVNESSDKLTYQQVTKTKYYRAVVQNPGCDTVYSAIGSVVVDEQPDVYTIEGANTVCARANEGVIELTDYNGVVKSWEFSDDGESSWQEIINKEATLQYTNLEKTTHFRVQLQSLYGKCTGVSTQSVKVTVEAPTMGGKTSGATTVCSDANEGTIELSGHRGQVQRWEKSASGKSPWQAVEVTSDNLVYTNLKEDTYFRAVVKNGNCKLAMSDSTLVAVDKVTNAGIITGATAHCAENNQGSLTLTGYTGEVTKWEKSTDKLAWQYKSSVNGKGIEFQNLTDTTYYRAIVKSGVCPADTTDIASVKIWPLPEVRFVADTAELGNDTHFTNKSTAFSGSLAEYQWDFDNGTASTAKHPVVKYDEAKTYFVSLKVRSDKGCLDSVRNPVEVNAAPQVDFAADNICLGDTMRFVNHSWLLDGDIRYSWDFGDGNTSAEAEPAHHYLHDGIYTVTLTATTHKGVQRSKTRQVEVYTRARVDFSMQDACENETIAFINQSGVSNGSLTFQWNFGDGNSSAQINPGHGYQQFGAYDVELVATTNHSCKDTLVKQVNIHPVPQADFHAADAPYQTPVVFADLSEIPTGSIATWSWNFGDGSFSDLQQPTRLYAAPGTYLVNLSVTSEQGCTHAVAKNITIAPLPDADFRAEDVCDGQPVLFVNQSSVLSGSLNYHWQFGDGTTSSERNPSHQYAGAGVYPVTLIVSSSQQGRDTVQKRVEVYPNPQPAFSVPDVCDGAPSHFANNSVVASGTIASCQWDFGDGTNSVQYNPVKQYLNPGVYEVQLTTVSDKGCRTTASAQAYVRQNPLADFTVANECVGERVAISNHTQCDEGNVAYYWDLGDGENSILENPVHHYKGAGVYRIKLLATSSFQCVDSLSRYVSVYDLPAVDAGKDTAVSRGFSVRLAASGATIFDWSPEESLDNPGIFNPVARPMETTRYTVRGIDEHGCENSDDLLVTVKDDFQVTANNVLTPDYNGQNDTWTIRNIDAYEQATVYIFNRWGKEVYRKQGYANDWDGRNSNGDILPDGTYYYIIKFSGGNAHYSGSITLLRNQ